MSDPAAPDPGGLGFLAHSPTAADRSLARELGLPITGDRGSGFTLLLTREGEVLQLLWGNRSGPGPVTVDFQIGAMRRRWQTATRKQPLARAVGMHRGIRRVLDATAGLGLDALTLAVLGCEVTAVERHPVLVALLRDGLGRAANEPALQEAVARLTLEPGDARQVMPALAPQRRPETVYLDPMFPRKGSAQVKAHAQALRALVGPEEDQELLVAARACASRRVVVKRHPHARPLGGKPDLVVTGSRVRYHVYFTAPGQTQPPTRET
jgi:16S rRNA (guanine1516-N2)-methyltransferase